MDFKKKVLSVKIDLYSRRDPVREYIMFPGPIFLFCDIVDCVFRVLVGCLNAFAFFVAI